MKQSVDFRCKCGGKTKFYFKKPHVVEPTIAHMECNECKSKWMHRLSVVRGEPDKVSTQSKPTWISPVLIEILAEESEFNSKPVEETGV